MLIAGDAGLEDKIIRCLQEQYPVRTFPSIQSSLDYIYNSPPDLIIGGTSCDDSRQAGLLRELKADPVFGQMPVLGVIGDGPANGWEDLPCDDCIRTSQLESDLLMRVHLCLSRTEHIVEINPLTRLPGNNAIIRLIQRNLDDCRFFGLAYADLDHFKPFNDRYGFSRGDEVLKMTGRLITNVVRSRQARDGFAGHIGGDDFIFIMDPDLIEETAEEITGHFDKIVPTFYDNESKATRSIESVDRDGSRRTFPILSVSIGIVTNRWRRFTHYGEMTEVAAEMKRYAKGFAGSCCKADRRTGR